MGFGVIGVWSFGFGVEGVGLKDTSQINTSIPPSTFPTQSRDNHPPPLDRIVQSPELGGIWETFAGWFAFGEAGEVDETASRWDASGVSTRARDLLNVAGLGCAGEGAVVDGPCGGRVVGKAIL